MSGMTWEDIFSTPISEPLIYAAAVDLRLYLVGELRIIVGFREIQISRRRKGTDIAMGQAL
jgi:hypothetical protein